MVGSPVASLVGWAKGWDVFRIRTCRCSCFGLEKDITIDLQAPSAPPVCARCDSHGVASRLSDDDHVALYARALEDAKDETSLAHGDRDFYRNRSLEVSKAAGTLIRALTAVDSLHHERGGAATVGMPCVRCNDCAPNRPSPGCSRPTTSGSSR